MKKKVGQLRLSVETILNLVKGGEETQTKLPPTGEPATCRCSWTCPPLI